MIPGGVYRVEISMKKALVVCGAGKSTLCRCWKSVCETKGRFDVFDFEKVKVILNEMGKSTFFLKWVEFEVNLG